MTNARDERAYRIIYPDTDAQYNLSMDGGHHEPPQAFGEIIVETRERVGSLEAQILSNQQSLNRIEEKVGEVEEDVQAVEEKTLDKEYFRENYRGDIERNSTINKILVWGGGVLLALTGIASTTAAAMGVI